MLHPEEHQAAHQAYAVLMEYYRTIRKELNKEDRARFVVGLAMLGKGLDLPDVERISNYTGIPANIRAGSPIPDDWR